MCCEHSVEILAYSVRNLCRKSWKRTAKQVVEHAHETALAGCVQEHRERRLYAAEVLEAILVYCSMQPARLAQFRHLTLAALAVSREEVLWHFLHVNEVCCKQQPVPSTESEVACSFSSSDLRGSLGQYLSSGLDAGFFFDDYGKLV